MHSASDFIHAYEHAEELGRSSLNRRLVSQLERWNDVSAEQIVHAACGHLAVEDETYATHDGQVCEYCNDNHYVDVADSEYRRRRDEVYLHDDGDYYTYSEQSDDDDEDDEDDNSVGGRVKNYTTNVLSYYGSDTSIKPTQYGDFLMGIELEVVPRGGRNDPVHHTIDNLADGYAILKNDSSLSSGGFEIVTAPRGLKEHIERFGAWTPYKTLRAWDAGCCGLHVHISSQAFSQATLGKFIEFICNVDNDPMIMKIAGRSPTSDNQAQQYCRRDGVFPGNIKATLRAKSDSGDRYRMVNTQNLGGEEAERLGLSNSDGRPINTIELRIFRASLKKSRLLAQIEFAHAAVMFCRWTSMRELRFEHFEKWLRKSAGMYPNLAKWFGVRANSQTTNTSPEVVAEAEV
jgi:hypothetical protein